MTKTQKLKITLIACLLLLAAIPANAARLYFEPQEQVIGTEKDFSVVVNIDAGKSINAIQAVLYIPQELVPIDISEGNSIINFWVEKPNFDEATRLLTFSGIIPGDFKKKKPRS